MTRALVLGGGGPVGRGWESGLLVGLAEWGIDLGGADLIVGTSAGSVVGAQLALKMDLAATVAASVGETVPAPPGVASGMGDLIGAMADAVRAPEPEATRARIGRMALAANTVDEDTYLGRTTFSAVEDREWPAAFRATAVNALTGGFRVWDRSSRVPLPRALASSCSVPGIYPPVTVGATRYMDGGVRSMLNADLAAGHAAVVVVSCFALGPPEGANDPVSEALNRGLDAELAKVRSAGSALEVVVPSEEFLRLSGRGTEMMNTALVQDAFRAGLRQANVEAGRLRALWDV